MPFHSLTFGAFVLAALAAYYAVPRRARWKALLTASAAYYLTADVRHAWIAAVLIGTSYVTALAAARSASPRTRRAVTWAGVLLIAGVLGVSRALGTGSATSFAIPFGISFLALRLAGYLIDVHRGSVAAETHPGIFTLFAIVFPELPAGPIERAGALVPQLRQPAGFSYADFTSGVRLFTWGLFKKLVIADRLRAFVEAAYDAPQALDGASCAVATVLFAFQIYCDFSGYSDMAIGLGRMFGLRLSPNFDRPYGAKSIASFWSRWHMSLSSWLRDFVFLPLAFRTGRAIDGRLGSAWLENRVAYAVAAFATMAACGLWHGASWTFVAWGMSMAALMVTSVFTRPLRRRSARALGGRWLRPIRDASRVTLTFVLVSATWVFFRAGSVGDAVGILRAIPGGVIPRTS